MKRLHELLDVEGLDAILIRREPAIRAFAHVESDNAALLLTRRGARLYTDFRFVAAVHRTAPDLAVSDIKGLYSALNRLGVVRLGVEFGMSHASFLKMTKKCPRATFVDVSERLAELRAVKSAKEIAGIAKAAVLNDEIWLGVRENLRPGTTEREIAAQIDYLMTSMGDGPAFETIVCVGKNAAECHHRPDRTVWTGEEPILVDMGVRLDGWCSDMTRNVVPPHPTRLYRKIYDLVLRANEAAIKAARPGMTGKALDRVARKIIADAGYGEAFGHSLGHGVGVEVHESPMASRRSKDVLKPGMFVTIEPGVYLEGRLGVRIEDLVVITADGCDVLSRSEK